MNLPIFSKDHSHKAFTLVELLIVIGIFVIVSAIVVVILNPVEIFKQTRDGKRLSDLATLNKAVHLASLEISGSGSGAVSTVYVSIPDSNATSTAGTNCIGLGLPDLPLGWSYHCSNPAYFRKTNGTGWVPINFTSFQGGSLLEVLPIDPINSTSSGSYYTYVTGGSYILTSLLESQKHLNAFAMTDGGFDAGKIEIGSDKNLWAAASGIVGWWKFENNFNDSSLYGNNGSGVNGTTFASGKVGNAASFDGANDYVSIPNSVSLQVSGGLTMEAWIRSNNLLSTQYVIDKYPANYRLSILPTTWRPLVQMSGPGILFPSTGAISLNTWHHFIATYDASGGPNNFRVYKDGNLLIQMTRTQLITPGVNSLNIGNNFGAPTSTNAFKGLIDEVKIYNRALSRAEVQANYNAAR